MYVIIEGSKADPLTREDFEMLTKHLKAMAKASSPERARVFRIVAREIEMDLDRCPICKGDGQVKNPRWEHAEYVERWNEDTFETEQFWYLDGKQLDEHPPEYIDCESCNTTGEQV